MRRGARGMTLELLVIAALAVYAVTVVVTQSDIALPFRRGFREVASLTKSRMLVRWYETTRGPEPIIEDEKDRDPEIELITGSDPISCRLCVGFWVSLAVCFSVKLFEPVNILAVYGGSYFLAKSERF